ncbi:MAG: hypothetical protein ACYTBJ_12725 [Planctomycetota bacterium]
MTLAGGREHIGDNLRVCYDKLVSMSLVGAEELKLLDLWLEDIGQISQAAGSQKPEGLCR